MRKFLTAAYVVCAILFYGCAPALYVNYLDNSKKSYPINPADVKIFLAEKEIPSEHDRVAIIEIKDADADANLLRDMREQAAMIGANGVIQLENIENGNTTFSGSLIQGIRISEKRNVKFLAIRFKVDGEYPKKYKVGKDDMY